MTTTRIDNVRLVVPGEKIATGSLRLAAGKIAAVDFHPVAGKVPLLTPGLIDVHTHGIERHIYEAGPDALQAGATALARYGTTSVLPTLYAALTRDTVGSWSRRFGLNSSCAARSPLTSKVTNIHPSSFPHPL
ncbi:MAG: hypothetical protein WCP35_02100 [Verrucomicrobiota bacterium]